MAVIMGITFTDKKFRFAQIHSDLPFSSENAQKYPSPFREYFELHILEVHVWIEILKYFMI